MVRFQHFLDNTLPHHFTKNKKKPPSGKYGNEKWRGRPKNAKLAITTKYRFDKED